MPPLPAAEAAYKLRATQGFRVFATAECAKDGEGRGDEARGGRAAGGGVEATGVGVGWGEAARDGFLFILFFSLSFYASFFFLSPCMVNIMPGWP